MLDISNDQMKRYLNGIKAKQEIYTYAPTCAVKLRNKECGEHATYIISDKWDEDYYTFCHKHAEQIRDVWNIRTHADIT